MVILKSILEKMLENLSTELQWLRVAPKSELLWVW